MSIEWLDPHWLLLLPLLIVAALVWRRLGGPGEPAGLASGALGTRRFLHPLAGLLAPGGRAGGPGRRWPQGLTWAALACLVLALAQPVRVGERLPEPPEQRDIVFIVDVSAGMLQRDYEIAGERIARMDLLKRLLDDLIARLEGDRVGIVVFGESVHTLVPLTGDRDLARQMLGRIDTGVAGRFKALGNAIALAVKEAAARPGGEHRILVLLSDAKFPTGDIAPLAAAELAAEAGLPLYTAAIGATTYAAAEEQTSGLIYHPANPDLLGALAERTGARSYHAGGSDALAEAVRDITARRPGAPRPPEYARLPLYQWLVSAAALLLLARFAAPARQRGAA